MNTGHNIIRIVAQRTGFDLEHIQNVALNLVQSGEWSIEDRANAITSLLLALFAEAEPKSAASIARQYASFTANEFDSTAGKLIEGMLKTFLAQAQTDFSAWAYQTRIEVFDSAPAVRVVTPLQRGRFRDCI